VALKSSKATCTVSFSNMGANAVVVIYSGNTNYAPSTSALLEETVSRATTTRLISSGNPLAFELDRLGLTVERRVI
jgi:hypothetical protein